MYVCLCKGVTDKQIRDAVNSGAESLRAVRIATNAMTQCGKCAAEARSIIEEVRRNKCEEQPCLYYELA